MPDDQTMRERLIDRVACALDSAETVAELDERFIVDAILDELSEPTEAMIEGGRGYGVGPPAIRLIFRDMIDTAKQERG